MKKPSGVPLLEYVTYGLIRHFRKKVVRNYFRILLFMTPAWKAVVHFQEEAAKRKHFTKGYSHYEKYYTLYRIVRKLKPTFILECGSGITTAVMLSALQKNGSNGKLISMDELPEFGYEIKEIIGDSPQLELHVSPAISAKHGDLHGEKYAQIPDYPYDLIFVDGPMTKEVDLDAFYILEKRPHVPVLIDSRVKTVHALKEKYGGTFNAYLNMGFINMKS